MRQYRALLRGQGTSIVDLYWARCIINMSGFDLRQAQAASHRLRRKSARRFRRLRGSERRFTISISRRQDGYLRWSVRWRVLETLVPANNQENANNVHGRELHESV
jgi:hypothetical protein